MTMKTLDRPPRLIVKDDCGAVGVFYGQCALLGLGTIGCSLGFCSNAIQGSQLLDYLGVVVGTAILISALALLYETPITKTIFHRDTGAISIRQVGLLRNSTTSFRCVELKDVIVETIHSPAGPTYQLHLAFKSGQKIPLSTHWTIDRSSLDDAAAAIASVIPRDPPHAAATL
jgi:hypothetical protein